MKGKKSAKEGDGLGTRLSKIQDELVDEYLQPHDSPWIIGYSGGKDSTLVTHLVYEMLTNLPASKRKRQVHIVANNTLVESPLVMQHIEESIQEISYAAKVMDLPLQTEITRPLPEQSFWVNLIGRGYATPNSSFRWCTDRMKIRPTNNYIKNKIKNFGQVILLLGVRRNESGNRKKTVQKYDNGERLNRHNDLQNCMVYRPILDLSTKNVWEFLSFSEPPWGGSHLKLIGLYRDANGGDCPVVTQKADAPSCGTNSSRFGCWTCTVVKKDRSLEGLVESGYQEFGPLLDFRDWLVSIRNDKSRRQARRRNGQIKITNNGVYVPGPFTLKTRGEILERLQEVEIQTQRKLITEEEINLIHQIWAQDSAFLLKIHKRTKNS